MTRNIWSVQIINNASNYIQCLAKSTHAETVVEVAGAAAGSASVFVGNFGANFGLNVSFDAPPLLPLVASSLTPVVSMMKINYSFNAWLGKSITMRRNDGMHG